MATQQEIDTKIDYIKNTTLPASVNNFDEGVVLDFLNEQQKSHAESIEQLSAPGAVTTTSLADNAVTTSKIKDKAVTADKLAEGVLTAINLGTFSTPAAAYDAARTKAFTHGITSLIFTIDQGRGVEYTYLITQFIDDYANVAIQTMTAQGKSGSTFMRKLTKNGSTITAGAWTECFLPVSITWNGNKFVCTTIGGATKEFGADLLITAAMLADGSITTAKLAPGAVLASKLADSAVTTSKIKDKAVTADKLAEGVLTAINLGTFSTPAAAYDAARTKAFTHGITSLIFTIDQGRGVEYTYLITQFIDDYANVAIQTMTAQGKSGSTFMRKLTKNGSTITAGAWTECFLPVSITWNGNKFVCTTIGGATKEFGADLLITAAMLADGSITTAKLAPGAVLASKLADSAVTTSKIKDKAVTADKLADQAIATEKIADNAVSTDKLADHSVTKKKLSPDITARKELPINVAKALPARPMQGARYFFGSYEFFINITDRRRGCMSRVLRIRDSNGQVHTFEIDYGDFFNWKCVNITSDKGAELYVCTVFWSELEMSEGKQKLPAILSAQFFSFDHGNSNTLVYKDGIYDLQLIREATETSKPGFIIRRGKLVNMNSAAAYIKSCDDITSAQLFRHSNIAFYRLTRRHHKESHADEHEGKDNCQRKAHKFRRINIFDTYMRSFTLLIRAVALNHKRKSPIVATMRLRSTFNGFQLRKLKEFDIIEHI